MSHEEDQKLTKANLKEAKKFISLMTSLVANFYQNIKYYGYIFSIMVVFVYVEHYREEGILWYHSDYYSNLV